MPRNIKTVMSDRLFLSDLFSDEDVYHWNISGHQGRIPPPEKNPIRLFPRWHGGYPLPGQSNQEYLKWMSQHGKVTFVESGLCLSRGGVNLELIITDFTTETKTKRVFISSELSIYPKTRIHTLDLLYRGYSPNEGVEREGIVSPKPIYVGFK